ncbi:MAG TPA: MerR family transcriptional regulator [candidate division Zixibacteria bacterium]|nr:MerR family transcriptional regulator [candidate division Zixibacteria bacterium]
MRHPIKVAAVRSGLSAHLIRIWEKRYQAITPERTPGNRRLYSDREIDRLILLKQATQAGESIGQIARLGDEQLRQLVRESGQYTTTQTRRQSAGREPQAEAADIQRALNECLRAAQEMDPVAIEKTLLRASISLGRQALLERLLLPLLQKIGERWRAGELKVGAEHLASAVLRSFMGGMLATGQIDERAPVLLATTPQGQLHEFGALAAAVTGVTCGWRAVYLGPNLPADEIAAAFSKTQAQALALSLAYPPDDPHLPGQLRSIRELLPPETPIVVGGRAAKSYEQVINELGFTRVADLTELFDQLEILRVSRPSQLN